MSALSHTEIRRYARHLIMPEVGMQGQQKLKDSAVLLVGTGGLGSPAALYLAAAGVGRIGLLDGDVVEESNLQRQVVHGQASIGKPKVESAKLRLQDINPHITLDTHHTQLTSANAVEIFKQYDVVADGTDNFPTRYLVNDACYFSKKPNVYASIFRFEGQLSVFDAARGPCYRCLYSEPPPPGLVPSCAEGGVLGILPGTMGMLQATEVIKLLLNLGEPLIGRLLLYDALDMRFRELKLRKDPTCVLCGPDPSVTQLIDYEQFCGVPAHDHEVKKMSQFDITPSELKARMDQGPVQLIDVREPHEWDIARIEGAKLIPLRELPQRVSELDGSKEIVLHCKMGGRSRQALEFLRGAGFKDLKNLAGGINGWSEEVDASVPLY